MTLPEPWVGVLLALAAYRVFRIVGYDTITQPVRERVTGYKDSDELPADVERAYLAKLVRCPWCLGWWISLGVWLVYETWPYTTARLAVPFALSAAVGMIGRNLDG